MQKLKISDYIEILKYYNKPIPKINKEGRKMIRREAEKIINDNEINIFYMQLEILTYIFQYEGFCFPARALISNVYIIIKGFE